MSPKHSNNLRHYRLKRHLTQQQVMQALGHKSASRLSAWENGEAVPSSEHLVTLSDLYRVPIDKLVGGYAKKKMAAKSSAQIPEPKVSVDDNEYRRYFGKAYEEMTEEDLVAAYAKLIVEAYFHSKGITLEPDQEADFLQTGSSTKKGR